MKCVITDFMGDDTIVEEAMLHDAGIDTFVSPHPEQASWITEAVDAHAILTRHARIDEAAIDSLRHCRVIARYGTGFDNIDIGAAKQRGILVTAVPGFGTEEVANHTLAMILMSLRQIPRFTDAIRNGGWNPSPLPAVPRISDLKLGLLGCGQIGRAVVNRAKACGFSVIAHDPYLTTPYENIEMIGALDDLVKSSDVLSIHAPLTSETRGVIDARRLRLLPQGAVVVNVARGPLLDLEAAMDLLENGHLGGLAIDVFETEPLPPDHRIRRMDRAIVTPHVGYYSIGSLAEAKRLSVSNIVEVLTGNPPITPVPYS